MYVLWPRHSGTTLYLDLLPFVVPVMPKASSALQVLFIFVPLCTYFHIPIENLIINPLLFVLTELQSIKMLHTHYMMFQSSDWRNYIRNSFLSPSLMGVVVLSCYNKLSLSRILGSLKRYKWFVRRSVLFPSAKNGHSFCSYSNKKYPSYLLSQCGTCNNKSAENKNKKENKN